MKFRLGVTGYTGTDQEHNTEIRSKGFYRKYNCTELITNIPRI